MLGATEHVSESFQLSGPVQSKKNTYSGSGPFDVAYGEVNWQTIVDTAANRQSQEPTLLPPYK